MPHPKGPFFQLLLLPVFFISLIEPGGQSGTNQTAETAKLAQILRKTADYCRKLENAVLDFVCLEEVKETLYYEDIERQFHTGFYQVLSRAKDSTFLYEYQLIGNGKKTQESRTLIKRNGKKCREKASGVGTTRFRYENVIYGPIDLLKSSRQPYYDYAIIGEEPLLGNKAFIIEAIPKPSQREYCPFGKIWVRESDFAILKIEYNRRSIKSLYADNQAHKPGSDKQRFELTSEFDIEQNGIRFPSRLLFQESNIGISGNTSVRSRALVTYKDYRFFTVTVEVDYR